MNYDRIRPNYHLWYSIRHYHCDIDDYHSYSFREKDKK